MKILRIFLVTMLISFTLYAKSNKLDSIEISNLKANYKNLENQLQEVRRDELNYQIEKDLLKETYSNNYTNISLFITVTLGIIGILGYLGIRDINSIKKEYLTELAKLTQLQAEVAQKYKEFESSKEKYENEVKEILKTNDEQNNKIKVLELKDRIRILFRDEQYDAALEYVVVALELSPEDVFLLRLRANLYSKSRRYADARRTLERIIAIDKENKSAIYDLAEVLILDKNREEHESLINQYRNEFETKMGGKLLEIFAIIIAAQDNNIVELTRIAQMTIRESDLKTKKKRISGWQFKDILIYFGNEIKTQSNYIAQCYFWYLDGQISGEDFYTRTKIGNK